MSPDPGVHRLELNSPYINSQNRFLGYSNKRIHYNFGSIKFTVKCNRQVDAAGYIAVRLLP
jgi:hypothetical protein